MPYKPQGQVEINGNMYYVTSPPRVRTYISPFSPKFGSGPPKYSDFAVASYQPYRDFRSGMSLLYGREDKTARYWHSTLDMRFPYQVTNLPLVTATTTTGINAEFIGGVDEINGVVVAFSHASGYSSKMWSLSGSAFTIQ